MKNFKNKIIALIPARKGSRSIKNKNLIKIFNKPLIYYTIKAAKSSNYINEIYVSTDSKKILNYSRKQGIFTIERPKKYSLDNSSANTVVKHFINSQKKKIKNKDIIIYLQPTSPFRNYKDIDKSLNLFLKNRVNSLVSVKKINTCIYKTLYIENKLLKTFFNEKKMTISRQKVPTAYEVNGAIYIFTVEKFLKKNIFPIQNSLPFQMKGLKNLDLDDNKDLKILKKNKNNL